MTNRPPDITGSSLAIETLAVELALDLAVSELAIPARAVVVAAGPDHVAELCVNERRLLEGKVLELVEVLWRLSQLGAAGPDDELRPALVRKVQRLEQVDVAGDVQLHRIC